jgi:hypothetical protein
MTTWTIQSLALALLGAVVVALTRWFVSSEAQWIDSGQGVAIGVLLLTLLAVPVGAFSWPVQPRSWRRPAALWLGGNIGLVAVLAAAGGAGRNLFPFAVALQGILSALAIAGGALIGYMVRAAKGHASARRRNAGD